MPVIELSPTEEMRRVTQILADRVADIPSLEGVYALRENDDMECVVVGNDIPLDQRLRLHDVEWGLLAELPDVAFDLQIVDRRNRPLSEVLSTQYFDAAVDLADLRER